MKGRDDLKLLRSKHLAMQARRDAIRDLRAGRPANIRVFDGTESEWSSFDVTPTDVEPADSDGRVLCIHRGRPIVLWLSRSRGARGDRAYVRGRRKHGWIRRRDVLGWALPLSETAIVEASSEAAPMSDGVVAEACDRIQPRLSCIGNGAQAAEESTRCLAFSGISAFTDREERLALVSRFAKTTCAEQCS